MESKSVVQDIDSE